MTIEPFTRLVLLDGREIRLTNKEFSLLRVLATDPQRVFTRAELYAFVWGIRQPLPTRTLDTTAARLRRSLGKGFVINVWGIGYRLMDGPAPPPAAAAAAYDDLACPFCGGQLREAA